MLSFLQGEDARIAVVVAISAMTLYFVLRMTWRALSRQMARASVNNVPRPALFLPAIVFLAFFIHGGTKTNGLFSMMFARRSVGTVVTEAEIAAGHRLESVVTNESYSYDCPSNGVRDTAWHRAGGHSAFRRHDFEEEFPFGTNSIGHLTVFQEGSLYLRPRDESPLLKPYDGIFCFIPGVSDFWSYSDPSQRVFTWDRVLDYDRTNEVHSMQITHYPTGDFIVRLDDIEKNYRWINPDDWDGDGLANEIDATPQVCDGDFYGVAAALPEGANPDAYYWIDMCVTGSLGVATVRISCGEPTNLGDHVIIARTNEVFRVPLLKGAWYQIDSTLPASVVETSSSDVVVEPNEDNPRHYISVYYHVDFWFDNVGSLCNLGCSDNLGAVMSDLGGGCCLADIGATGFRWCCNADCNCGGSEHDMSACVTWEGYTSWFSSPVYCTCSGGTVPGEGEETQDSPQLSISVPRVIYTNNDGSAELSDLAPLSVSFTSAVATNGTVRVTCSSIPDGAEIWVDANKTRKVDFPVSIEIDGASMSTNFYIEGTAVSGGTDELACSVEWYGEEDSDPVMMLSKSSTVYCPIANVINSTLRDGERLCNPSGIIVGSNACFAVQFDGLEPPAADIQWSVAEGPVQFVGGNTGKKVYVTATAPNQTAKLRVQIGDCVSRPIEFTAFTVEPLAVKTTVWIVGNDEGTYFARSENDVRSMMTEVNKIYEQIGVSFYIDSISYMNRSDWLDIEESDGLKREDYQKRREIVNTMTNSDGLELYFIDYLSRYAGADHDVFGIVLSTNATAIALAHELGHAFGCADIYHAKRKNRSLITLNDDYPCESHAPLDWNNGSGARYYNSQNKQSNLICTLLMCGYLYPYIGDMSSGSVYGLTSHGESGMVDIGFFRSGSRRSIIKHR